MIIPLRPAHASYLAEIHCAALANDFLPSLGRGFLTSLYQGVLEQNTGFGFAALVDELMVGFVLGSADSGALFRRMLTGGNAFRLGCRALPAVLRRPQLAVNIVQTFRYPQKESLPTEKAELIVIAMDSMHQHQGYGRKLVESLNQAFRDHGVASYKVSVVQARENANRFYLALGFTKAGEFELYGKGWNLFRYILEHER